MAPPWSNAPTTRAGASSTSPVPQLVIAAQVPPLLQSPVTVPRHAPAPSQPSDEVQASPSEQLVPAGATTASKVSLASSQT